VAEDAEIS